MSERELMRVPEAARRAGVAERTIRMAIKAGSLKAYQPGLRKSSPFLIKPDDLDAWFESTQVSPGEAEER